MANPQTSIETFGNPPFIGDGSNRNSVHDILVDSVYAGYESLKLGIYKRVYNEKELDLPELDAFKTEDKKSESNKPSERGMEKHFAIHSGGRDRDYIMHFPPNYDPAKPMPLVVVLHGVAQDAEKIKNLSKMSEKADKEGFIVAYPNGTNWLGKVRSWDVDNGVQLPGTDSNDIGFMKDMISTIKKNVNIDDSRVYAAGFSNGGMLAYKMASEMSDTFSAVAVVSSGSSGKETKPSEAVSIMSIHGTSDSVIPLNGRASGESLVKLGVPRFESFQDSFRNWSSRLDISGKPVIERDGDSVVTARSKNHQTGAEVVAVTVRNGGHEWPGSDRAKMTYPGSPEANYPTTDKIWEFFQSHKKPGSAPVNREQQLLTAGV